MELVCPYCSSNLIQGFIDRGKYSFKWHNKELKIIESIQYWVGSIILEIPNKKL